MSKAGANGIPDFHKNTADSSCDVARPSHPEVCAAPSRIGRERGIGVGLSTVIPERS